MAPMPTEDRLAIEELFIRHTRALDGGDVRTVVECFTEDAAQVSPAVGEHAGHAAIRAFAERFARFRRDGNQLWHMISNLVTRVEGDRAHIDWYLAVFLTKDGRSHMLPPGQYDCELQRQNGRWRFSRRVVTHDHAYRLEGLKATLWRCGAGKERQGRRW